MSATRCKRAAPAPALGDRLLFLISSSPYRARRSGVDGGRLPPPRSPGRVFVPGRIWLSGRAEGGMPSRDSSLTVAVPTEKAAIRQAIPRGRGLRAAVGRIGSGRDGRGDQAACCLLPAACCLPALAPGSLLG